MNSNTSKSGGFNWLDFLSFKTMITLRIIQIVYAIIAAIITIGGLITMFSGSSHRGEFGGYGGGSILPSGPFAGLLIILFGNILWRIWCELIIVFFRINKSLDSIDDKTKG